MFKKQGVLVAIVVAMAIATPSFAQSVSVSETVYPAPQASLSKGNAISFDVNGPAYACLKVAMTVLKLSPSNFNRFDQVAVDSKDQAQLLVAADDRTAWKPVRSDALGTQMRYHNGQIKGMEDVVFEAEMANDGKYVVIRKISFTNRSSTVLGTLTRE